MSTENDDSDAAAEIPRKFRGFPALVAPGEQLVRHVERRLGRKPRPEAEKQLEARPFSLNDLMFFVRFVEESKKVDKPLSVGKFSRQQGKSSSTGSDILDRLDAATGAILVDTYLCDSKGKKTKLATSLKSLNQHKAAYPNFDPYKERQTKLRMRGVLWAALGHYIWTLIGIARTGYFPVTFLEYIERKQAELDGIQPEMYGADHPEYPEHQDARAAGTAEFLDDMRRKQLDEEIRASMWSERDKIENAEEISEADMMFLPER